MKFTTLAATAALSLAASASAFEVTFPSAGSDAYWVACQNNTLKWTFQQNDPSYFSVALLNSDQNALAGNYQIANSLNTTEGQATISLTCVPQGTYSVLFVNASQYSLNNPQVFEKSGTFTIRPNGTAPATATSVPTGSSTGTAASPTSTLSGSLSSAASVISGQASSSAGAHSAGSGSSSSAAGRFAFAPAAAGAALALSLSGAMALLL